MPLFEELDYRPTPMGELTLRRRRVVSLGVDVLEVKLGGEHLMSSLFTEGEKALAMLGLQFTSASSLDVLVGGLGLGYTAAAALEDPRVRDLLVIDALEAVIDWHRQGLVPLGERLSADPRCELRHADFFAYVEAGDGEPARRFHLILLDIDHSPRAVLHRAHARFYTTAGLAGLRRRLHPGGVFAMWSDEAPDPAFEAELAGVFEQFESRVVEFENPVRGGVSACTIYLARSGQAADA